MLMSAAKDSRRRGTLFRALTCGDACGGPTTSGSPFCSFSDASAHQLAAGNGRDTLTAVTPLFSNIDGMLSNMRPETRIQGVITEGGAALNVVPDKTAADFDVQYLDET
jgi:metal-dependent amidase/aminoacylase/carboxypeptidase family protein